MPPVREEELIKELSEKDTVPVDYTMPVDAAVKEHALKETMVEEPVVEKTVVGESTVDYAMPTEETMAKGANGG
jgi:hypothetical protein